MTGNLLRIHTVQNGHRIDEEDLDIDTPGAVLDKPAKWTVTIDNGDDIPLAVQSVHAQMLQRSLCFEAAGSGQYTLMLWRSSVDCGSLRLCHAVYAANRCGTGHGGTGATKSRIPGPSRPAPAHRAISRSAVGCVGCRDRDLGTHCVSVGKANQRTTMRSSFTS